MVSTRSSLKSVGAVDTKAQVDYKNVGLKVDYSPADRVSTFFRVGYFREERDNAKVTTVAPITPEMNDTEWKTLSAGLRASPDQSDLQASFFVDNNRFNSNFLAVPAVVGTTPVVLPRLLGRLTTVQHVPTDAVGVLVQWSKPISTRHLISAEPISVASKARKEEGRLFQTRRSCRRFVTGGTQFNSGTFVQLQYWPISTLSLTASGRVDHWRNYDAHYNETTVATGLPAARHLATYPTARRRCSARRSRLFTTRQSRQRQHHRTGFVRRRSTSSTELQRGYAADAGQREPRSRTASRRQPGQPRTERRCHDPHDVVRQPHEGSDHEREL